MCLRVRYIDSASVYDISIAFLTVPTVWYFFHVILSLLYNDNLAIFFL